MRPITGALTAFFVAAALFPAAPAARQGLPSIGSHSAGDARPEEISASAWKRMLEDIVRNRYLVRASAAATDARVLEAYNEAHQLHVVFTNEGVRVGPTRDNEDSWEWLLQLDRFGHEGSLEPLGKVVPVADGNRVEYRREALTEWYVNESRGIEQGFTVEQAPAREVTKSVGPLVLLLRATGLTARQDVVGKSILLTTDDSIRTLHYRGLLAWDAEGNDLPAAMSATEEGVRIEVDDAGATYPVTVDPFIESTILRASDAAPGDRFGGSVAISGDTAIVGAMWEDGGVGDPLPNSGAAYVFERDHGGADKARPLRLLREVRCARSPDASP